jgi:hypothetical protein
MDTHMDTIDTLASPPFMRVSVALRDVVNCEGKLDKRLYGCRWDILGVLMPYEPHPSYPALQCLPDDDFPGINLLVRVLRVFKPPSLVYGEYRWHVADNQETFGTGGLSMDCGEEDERQAIRLAKLSRGLVKPAGRPQEGEYFRDAAEFIGVAVSLIQEHQATHQRAMSTRLLARYMMPRFRSESLQGAIKRLKAYYKRFSVDLDALIRLAHPRP